MLHPFFIFLAVGLASAEHGWKAGSQYKYRVESRTLTGLHQVADQYSGLLVTAQLSVQVPSEDRLALQVNNARYADVHRNLSQGWSSEVSELELSYKKLPASDQPFELYLKNGVIQKMVVEKDTPQWQLNFYKSVASQLQVDTQAEHLKKSKINLLPKLGEAFGTYKTMEDSINGIYETLYDVSTLPEYEIQNRPELAPLPHLARGGQFINVVKTRNFSKSKQNMVYRFGANGREGWKAGTNQMGNFLSRSSVSRIVLSGNLNTYAIQSSVTEEKVVVAPHMHNAQKGIVFGLMNVTLQEVTDLQGVLPAIVRPKSITSLVYEYTEGNHGRYGGSSEEDYSASYSSSPNSEESPSKNTPSRHTKSMLEEKMNKSSKNERNKRSTNRESFGTKQLNEGQQLEFSDSSVASSSSFETSSEEYLPEEPEMNQAPRIEFFPYYQGLHESLKNNVVEQIKGAAHEVGQWILNPGRIPEDQILTYFSLLTHLIARASSSELSQATELLYYSANNAQDKGSQTESQKYHTWLAFRDAVAQAGTGPGLVMIREWIKNGKIRGEEAAQLVAVLPNAARYPTTDYMNYYFDMMKSDEVQRQMSLNTTAIISFSDLVRKSMVDHKTSTNRYATHLSGGKNKQHGREVRENYIPYLESRLKRAMAAEDSIKAQVYIRAIGQTAHPQLMAVFEPYLEGKRPATGFQRLSMITALDELTRVHPKLARRVLHRVYMNQGELPEIRVAAVMQLMKTNPSVQMLQHMAVMTNFDRNKQVNSAVKSAIESAAYSDEYNEQELTVNARAAVNMLTPESYGTEYSKNFIRTYVEKEQEQLKYKQQLSYIQGQDSIYPKSIIYEMYRTIGGYKCDPYEAKLQLSNADQFIEMLSREFVSQQKRSKAENYERRTYSYDKISNMLNIQLEPQEQLEGSIILKMLGGKRFFSFDNHTIEHLPKIISEYHQELQKGVDVHFTKFYNQYTMEVGFPLVTGFNFVYSLDAPTLLSFRGQIRGHLEMNEKQRQEGQMANLNGTFQMTYSAQKRGEMGFVSHFNNQKYIAGSQGNVLFHLPLIMKVEFKPEENAILTQIQPLLQNNNKQKLFQFSSDAYTTFQNTNVIQPHLKGQNAQKVHTKPIKHLQKTIGLEESGYAIDIDMRSEQNFMDVASLLKKMRSHDLISYVVFHDMAENIGNSYLGLSYNPQKSSPQPVTIGLSYLFDEEGKHEAFKIGSKLKKFMPSLKSRRDDISSAQPSSWAHRREELFRNVRQGIQDPNTRLVDIFFRFGGEESKNAYSLTVAHANSPVSHNSRLLAYFSANPVTTSEKIKPLQVAFQVAVKEPLLSVFNYEEALKSDPTTTMEGQIDLFEGSRSPAKISFMGEMKRTNSRKEFLQQHSLSAVCKLQMKEHNYIQPACRNATVNAYYLDQYNFAVEYQGLPTEVKAALYKAYSWLRYTLFLNNEENTLAKPNPEGQLSIGVQFSKNLNTVNISVETPTLISKFNKLKINQIAIPMIVYNAKYNQMALLSQKLLHHQPIFTAILDDNKVTTFSNITYPVDLGDCWHVLSMYVTHARNEYDNLRNRAKNNYQNFVILVKDRDNQFKDVQIILENDDFLLESVSGKPTVRLNGQPIQVTENKLSRLSNNQNSIEAHTLSDNTLVLDFKKNGIKVIYDTKRIQLSLSNSYRNKVRGLAGSFDGEPTEDFTLPDNRIQTNPRHLAASYALVDASCRGPAKQLHEMAGNSKSYEKRVIFGDVVSDKEAGRAGKSKHPNSVQATTELTR